MATLKDVAEKAGVSTATVSNVLTGAKHVRPELKRQVLDIISELNYSPRRSSKPSASTASKTLGIVITQLDCIFFPLVISGIQKIAMENDYDITFFPTNYNHILEKKYMQDLVCSNTAGIIFDTVVPRSDVEYFKSLAHLKVNGRKVPVVSIQEDLTHFGITSITLNSFLGGYMATEHLIQKGAKKIACITGPIDTGWATDRLTGFQNCLKENGLPHTSSYICTSDCTLLGGYQAANNFLLNALDFNGLFVQNDLMAIGAIKALREKNYKIPDDIKIIGFDNIFFSTLISPSLSTIHIPKQRLGEEAARCLIEEIKYSEKNVPRHIDLPLSLIERQSTNPAVEENWDLFPG